MTEPPFSRIGIAGLGLIGGSIALATRDAWPSISLTGCDDPDRSGEARRRGVIDDIATDVVALGGCDLIVLAAPSSATASLIAALATATTAGVVTDVGSTKRGVMRAAAESRLPQFVGGHPMAGGERSGLDYAHPGLFRDRPWLFVRGSADASADARLDRFVKGLGAVPHWLDADTHDRTVAYLSHLPQVLGVTLMNAAGEAIGDAGLSVAGRAFSEMTRLASSPPEMWTAIFGENADYVAEALRAFVGDLPGADDLASDRWVTDAFNRADALRMRHFTPARRDE